MPDLPGKCSAAPLDEIESRGAALRESLLQYWDRSRRELPWRGTTDPYRVWVSEIMLQQTRVETVIPYYRRWMDRFPDVEALARASRDEVLLAWKGLGYYRRAANLHAGARVVRDRLEGRVPSSSEALRALPGVGEYTAGAVASIAFGERAAAVDGNVRRVLARVFDEPAPSAAWLRRAAAALLDPARPGDWNQALMDLGATVCKPRNPACGSCPWTDACAARAAGTQHERPASVSRARVASRELAVAVVVDGPGKVLWVRRPPEGLLADLWAFPESPVSGDPHSAARDAAERSGAELSGGDGRALPPVRHRFTHLAATYRPVLLAGSGVDGENRRWVPLARRDELALPAAQEKIARAAEAALETF